MLSGSKYMVALCDRYFGRYSGRYRDQDTSYCLIRQQDSARIRWAKSAATHCDFFPRCE